jgi:hypothetical protein
MADDCQYCIERKSTPEGDKRMLVALQIACGEGDRDSIKSVWRQLYVMGLVDKEKPPGYY